jgi:hypothetical protein
LDSDVRQEQRRKDEKQVHDRAGEGDEDVVATAKATRPDDVGAIDADAELAYRNLEGGRSQDVTELMQEKTEEQYSSAQDAYPEAKGGNFKQEAQGNNHPSLLVHAEWNHYSGQGIHNFPGQSRKLSPGRGKRCLNFMANEPSVIVFIGQNRSLFNLDRLMPQKEDR